LRTAGGQGQLLDFYAGDFGGARAVIGRIERACERSARSRREHMLATARDPRGKTFCNADVDPAARRSSLGYTTESQRAPFGIGVQNGEEPEVEIRPLYDASDFEPGKGA